MTAWKTKSRTLDLTRHGAVMGVLNVTPDSFSDGGLWLDAEAAIQQGLRMVEEGAEIVDIGGESTRPGAAAVPAEEQLRRIMPVLTGLRARTEAVISIDTADALVAEAVLAAGADVINDVTGLRGDPGMAGVCASTGAGVVIMHMQGAPRTMQLHPAYTDVVAEVRAFFSAQLAAAVAAGIDPERLIFDPGIGFGKKIEHNLALLRSLGSLAPAGRPLLLGVSRKSFIGKLLDVPDPADRDGATVALTSWGRENGAFVHRVHQVLPNVHALRMTEAILHAGERMKSRLT